jgi:hypothetical protein
MSKPIILLVLAIALTGCNSKQNADGTLTLTTAVIDPEDKTSNDQCLRAKLFEQCLKALPAGPQATKYNDWDEVVHQCELASYRHSFRKMRYIKQECRHE